MSFQIFCSTVNKDSTNLSFPYLKFFWGGGGVGQLKKSPLIIIGLSVFTDDDDLLTECIVSPSPPHRISLYLAELVFLLKRHNTAEHRYTTTAGQYILGMYAYFMTQFQPTYEWYPFAIRSELPTPLTLHCTVHYAEHCNSALHCLLSSSWSWLSGLFTIQPSSNLTHSSYFCNLKIIFKILFF